MDPKPLKVTLLTAPQSPLETLWLVWEQSRHNYQVPSIEELRGFMDCSSSSSSFNREEGCPTCSATLAEFGYPGGLTKFCRDYEETVRMLLTEDVPVTENLTFVFLIENMPISLREQMVRHRIGTNFDDRLGVDIVPDLADSSWWSQTFRVLDMSNFHEDGAYFIPESLKGKYVRTPYGDQHADEYLKGCYHKVQQMYREMLQAGIAKEDARQILPLGTTHRITWQVNLKALTHIIGKRTCWIAQRGLWQDFIVQAVRELAEKVDPLFQELINPPCMKGGTFSECLYHGINRERVTGRDGFPPCPLWLHHHEKMATDACVGVNPKIGRAHV